MIEIENINRDESLKKLNFKYHPRAVKVRAASTFNTPTRIVLDKEYEKKANFPNDFKYKDYISVSVGEFDEEKLQKFLNQNGALRNLITKVNNFGKFSTDAYVQLLALKMPKNSSSILTETTLQRFLRFLDAAQENINTRSLPFFESKNISVKKLYNDFCKEFQENNPVIWLNMGEDENNFKDRLDSLETLVKDKRLRIIGLHWKDYKDANINYDNLYTRFGDKDVLLVLEGAPRKITNYSLSGVHFYPYMSFDAVSPYRRTRAGGSAPKTPYYAKSIINSQFLYRPEVLLEKLRDADAIDIEGILKPYKGLNENAIQLAETLAKDYKNLSQSEKKKGVELKDSNYDKNSLALTSNIMKNLQYAQQVIDGQAEMEELGKRIEKNDVDSYIESKTKLKKKMLGFTKGKYYDI